MGVQIKEKAIAIAESRNILFAVGLSIVFCIALYIFFANSTVRTLSVLQNTKEEVQAITMRVSEMESQRLISENTINPDLAVSLGFVEANSKTFIVKGNAKTAINFNSR